MSSNADLAVTLFHTRFPITIIPGDENNSFSFREKAENDSLCGFARAPGLGHRELYIPHQSDQKNENTICSQVKAFVQKTMKDFADRNPQERKAFDHHPDEGEVRNSLTVNPKIHVYFDQDSKYGLKNRGGWFSASAKPGDIRCGIISTYLNPINRTYSNRLTIPSSLSSDNNANVFLHPGPFATCKEVFDLFSQAQFTLETEKNRQQRKSQGFHVHEEKQSDFDASVRDKYFNA